jgi:hypothetical protein
MLLAYADRARDVCEDSKAQIATAFHGLLVNDGAGGWLSNVR